jgi:hypothetical protein
LRVKAPKANWKGVRPAGERLSCYEWRTSLTVAPDMKKMFFLSMLIPVGMICSCQKHDSGTEQLLAQREAALDTREKALDEREKALIQRERIMGNVRAVRPEPQSRQPSRDAAALQAERERRIQQLPPEFRALIPDASQIQADRARRTQGQVGQTPGTAEPDTTSASPTP